MNYQLFRSLKDAGFPFSTWIGGMKEHADPTLEELISAVTERGGAFVLWSNEDGSWNASHSSGKTNQSDQKGDTPVTAVAKLWLTLSRENA